MALWIRKPGRKNIPQHVNLMYEESAPKYPTAHCLSVFGQTSLFLTVQKKSK